MLDAAGPGLSIGAAAAACASGAGCAVGVAFAALALDQFLARERITGQSLSEAALAETLLISGAATDQDVAARMAQQFLLIINSGRTGQGVIGAARGGTQSIRDAAVTALKAAIQTEEVRRSLEDKEK